jgi:serine/threonine protein kinase
MLSGQWVSVESSSEEDSSQDGRWVAQERKWQLTKKLQDLLIDPFTKESAEAAMNLVREGANPNAVNRKGSCLLHFLASGDIAGCYSSLIEELVVKYRADLNIINNSGRPPLRVCSRTDLSTIRQLIRLGAKDRRGNSLLPLLEDKDLTFEKVSLVHGFSLPYLLDLSLFKKKKCLGEGANAKVFCYESKDGDVAVKELLKDPDEEQDSRNRGSLRDEVKTMRFLTEMKAENVIEFLGFNLDTQSYKLVMKYASRGALNVFMKENISCSNVQHTFVCGVINGLKHIHQYEIMHCDIKCRNILIDSMLQVKIADFGSARTINFLGKMQTTCTHRAPELEASPYTQKSDIFSLGIVMWEITNWVNIRQHLSPQADKKYMRDYYQSGQRPSLSEIPKGYATLISRCWDQDPQKRPTAEEAQKELHEQKLGVSNPV